MGSELDEVGPDKAAGARVCPKSASWELDEVERPFVEQLVGMGWRYVEGDLDHPARTGRSAFSEVVQEATLRRQLLALNLHEGQPWLDEGRLSQAVGALTRIPAHRLMEANRIATELLVAGITVEGLPGWDGGRGQTLHYIDWEHPERNEFTAVNQYRVDCPPGYNRGKAFIVPDLVLLVNGVPLVVIECKSPSVPEPLAEAVDQLRRYSNPFSRRTEQAANEGQQSQLLAAVEAAGLRWLPAQGRDAAGAWPPEPSLAVLDAPEAIIDQWLVGFEQFAAVTIDSICGCQLRWHPGVDLDVIAAQRADS